MESPETPTRTMGARRPIGPTPDPVPEQISHYRILSVLGEGGFGVVYLAEQIEPVRRRVAIKVIKPGMDSARVLARFEAERQALAMMDHPCIARVFDAGATAPEQGSRPYFVMEHVAGEPVTSYCNRHKLTVRARLELMIQICQAVQHAHNKGIIHRDLKPSNILVAISDRSEPQPKIIDFGVAKALHQPLGGQAIVTEQGQLIGTPEYMSPEQAEMGPLDIDTRSDVYSLGVVLYEILTGVRPFDLRDKTLAEIIRILREAEPPRPSTAISSMGREATSVAEARRTQARTLAGTLHRELEWIPLKALRKDRRDRYQSAAALAQDIRNYLDGQPLTAGPESAWYRLRKFARRNRLAVGAAAAIAAGGIVGTIGLVVGFAHERAGRLEAERQATISARFNEFVLEDLIGRADPHDGGRPDLTVREALDAAAARYAARFERDPQVLGAVSGAIGQAYEGLGLADTAAPYVLEAERLLRGSLGDDQRASIEASMNSAQLLDRLHRTAESTTAAESAAARAIGAFGPDAAISLRARAIRAHLWMHNRRLDEAEAELQAVLAAQTSALPEGHPDRLLTMAYIANVRSWTGRRDEAGAIFHQIATLRASAEGPDSLRAATEYLQAARLSAPAGGDAEEIRAAEAVLDLRRRTLGASSAWTHSALVQLEQIYERAGRFADAERVERETVTVAAQAFGANSSAVRESESRLGWVLLAQNKLAEAIDTLEPVLAVWLAADGGTGGWTQGVMWNLADAYDRLDRPEDAEPLLRSVVELRSTSLGPQHLLTLQAIERLGWFLERRGRGSEALTVYEQLLAAVREVGEQRTGQIEDVLGHISWCARLAGQTDRSVEARQELIALLQNRVGPDDPETLRNVSWLAWLLGTAGRFEAALPVYESLVATYARLGALESAEGLSARGGALWCCRSLSLEERADKLAAPLIEDRTRVQGRLHEDSLAEISLWAHFLAERSRHGEAAVQFLELHDRRAELAGPADTAAQAALERAAWNLARDGQNDAAAMTYRELARQSAERLGPDDEMTLTLSLSVAWPLRQAGKYEEAASAAEGVFDRALATHKPILAKEAAQALVAIYNAARDPSAAARWAGEVSRLENADVGGAQEGVPVAAPGPGPGA